MNRILILGCSGGGKSTLTRILSDRLNLPAVHLDVHFWRPNWVKTPRDEWREKVTELVKPESWVMDGTFSESFDIRFPRADLIVIVNQPRWICLYRAVTRVFKYSKKKRRPDMATGCDETFDLSFYRYIWTYNKKVLPKVMRAVDEYDCHNKVIHLRSDSDIEEFIQKIENEMGRIRPAAVNEADFLSKLAVRSKAHWPYDEDFIADCKEDLRLNPIHIENNQVFVFEKAGIVLGYYAFCEQDGEPEMIALFVEPESIGTGVGYKLWEHSVRFAKEQGWPQFKIAADPYAAEKFYLKLGCKKIGEYNSPVREGRVLPLLSYKVL